MPTFTPLTPFTIDFRRADFTAFGVGRDPRIHLSAIIKARKAAAGEKVTGIEGEQENVRAQLGFLWERVAELLWAGVPYKDALEAAWKEYVAIATVQEIPERGPVDSQLHIECDDIPMTPDGVDLGGRWLESYKLTWRSQRKWDEEAELCNSGGQPVEFWSWLSSEAGYLRALNSRCIPTTNHNIEVLNKWEGHQGPPFELLTPLQGCRFFIFWINGDYSRKPGRGPQATFTEVRWTEEELEQEWKVNLRYHAYLLKLKKEAAA